ncbi:ArnT family glycosyltransferase [Pararhizobium mangrovi]|nr:glycosyltransferase family 39 protein [Pararhizobium mangrovi]
MTTPTSQSTVSTGHRAVNGVLRFLESRTFVVFFILLTIVVVFLTYRYYGFSYDETYAQERGMRLWRYYFHGHTLSFMKTNFYGMFPDFVAVALQHLIPAMSYWSRHLVSALFGVVGIVYVYKIGSAFFGRLTGSLAMVFLTVNPMWNGYMFINMKDIPFATFMVAGFYYCMRAALGRYTSRSIWVGVAVSVGLLATAKVIGVVILGSFCFVALGAYLIFDPETRLDKALAVRIAKIIGAVVIGCIVMLALFWPQIYLYTPKQLMTAILAFTDFDYNGRVILNGITYHAQTGPRIYMLTYLTICMPIFLLIAVIAGGVLTPIRRHPMAVACVGIIVLYIVYQAVTHATVYGGYRHFTFLIPLAMLVAAWAAAKMLGDRRPEVVRVAGVAVLLLGTAWTLVGTYRVFPYQYSFYNVLVGGLKGAENSYEVDVWRTAPTYYLNRLATTARLTGERPKVHDCSTRLRKKIYPEIDFVDRDDAQYLITNRRSCTKYPDVPTISTLSREGVVLSELHERQPASE